jgi:hypothetical protein
MSRTAAFRNGAKPGRIRAPPKWWHRWPMSASSSTGAPARQHATEDVGWCREKDSWAFQRSTFRVPGNPLAFGGYGHLRRIGRRPSGPA